MSDALTNYIASSYAAAPDGDLQKLGALVEGTIVIAGCIEHARKIVSLSEVHTASSADGVSTSPYSSSCFAFSDKGKGIVEVSEGTLKHLVGPVDLAVTDEAAKLKSTSAFVGVVTRFGNAYNDEVKKIKTLCKENKWHVPGVYTTPFKIPSGAFVGYRRAKVKDLGTLDALLNLAKSDVAVHWSRDKSQWVALNSRLDTNASVEAGVIQIKLEELVKHINGVVDNQCQHAGSSSSIQDNLTDLYELNLKVALAVIDSKTGGNGRIQRAQSLVAYSDGMTAADWVLTVSTKSSPTGPFIPPRTTGADGGLFGSVAGSTPSSGHHVTPVGNASVIYLDDSSGADSDTYREVKADLDAMLKSSAISAEEWTRGILALKKDDAKRQKKKKKRGSGDAASSGL